MALADLGERVARLEERADAHDDDAREHREHDDGRFAEMREEVTAIVKAIERARGAVWIVGIGWGVLVTLATLYLAAHHR